MIRKIGGLTLLAFTATSHAFAETEQQTLEFVFTVAPVRTLHIVSERGTQSLELGPIVPSESVYSETLQVTVHTNTRQRYRIYHKMGELMSTLGRSLPTETLFLSATHGERGGKSEQAEAKELSSERTLLFRSGGELGTEDLTKACPLLLCFTAPTSAQIGSIPTAPYTLTE